MGVKGLHKFLKTHAPNSITEKDFISYYGSVQAVDMSIIIYKFIIAIRNTGSDLTRPDGKMVSHIHGVFHKIISLLRYGIFPVPIFDGKPPDIKSSTIKERRNVKHNAIEKLKDTNISDEERIRLYKRTAYVTDEHIGDIKKLLSLMGIRYIQAPEEADSQCAALNISGKVDGVVSEDMDTLTFGAPKMIRNFSNKSKVEEIDLDTVLTELDLTHSQFIDICIIFGSGYCKPIKGIGTIQIYNKYKSAGSMENFLKSISGKCSIPSDFEQTWRKVKSYYTTAKVRDPTSVKIVWDTPDREGLIDFMCNENSFKRSTTVKKIDELMSIYDKYLSVGSI